MFVYVCVYKYCICVCGVRTDCYVHFVFSWGLSSLTVACAGLDEDSEAAVISPSIVCVLSAVQSIARFMTRKIQLYLFKLFHFSLEN